MEYLQQAIAEDPSYAPAYAALAEMYYLRVLGFVPIPRSEAYPKARSAAYRAVELDQDLADAHTSLGMVKLFFEGDRSGAEKEFKRALDLNPNDANAHFWYGNYLKTTRQQKEALSELQRAWDLDPLSPDRAGAAGSPYRLTREYDKQIYYLQKALELDPNFALAHHNLALVYIYQRKFTEALQESQRAIDLGVDNTQTLGIQAEAYAGLGQRAKALKLLAEFEQGWRRGLVPAVQVALLHLVLGDKEQALAWLEKSFRDQEWTFGWGEWMKDEPEWDPIRSDPRFQDILRRMSFPQ